MNDEWYLYKDYFLIYNEQEMYTDMNEFLYLYTGTYNLKND